MVEPPKNAYQNFLDFFDRRDRERLDGLNEGHFAGMAPEERRRAFNYLLRSVEAGGGAESIHSLFTADWERAVPILKRLLEERTFQGEAEVIAAWNVYRVEPESALLAVFIRAMSNERTQVRAAAAYYVPTDIVTLELITALKQMVRTETDQLASIHAVNALLACYSVSKESIGTELYLKTYRGLRSPELQARQAALKQLDDLYN